MEGHLEALLEMDFCNKPLNFGVEAHIEAPTGDALSSMFLFFFQKSYFAYRRIGLFSKTEFSRGVCHMCGPQVPLHCVPDMWARAHGIAAQVGPHKGRT
jgi:hypothetical protein